MFCFECVNIVSHVHNHAFILYPSITASMKAKNRSRKKTKTKKSNTHKLTLMLIHTGSTLHTLQLQKQQHVIGGDFSPMLQI